MFATFLNSWRQRSSLPWYSFTAHLKRNVSALSYSGKVKLFQRLSGEEKFSWIAEEAPGWDHTWATAGGWEPSWAASPFSIPHICQRGGRDRSVLSGLFLARCHTPGKFAKSPAHTPVCGCFSQVGRLWMAGGGCSSDDCLQMKPVLWRFI